MSNLTIFAPTRPYKQCSGAIALMRQRALQLLHDAGDATRRRHHLRAERYTAEASALNRAASWLADMVALERAESDRTLTAAHRPLPLSRPQHSNFPTN